MSDRSDEHAWKEGFDYGNLFAKYERDELKAKLKAFDKKTETVPPGVKSIRVISNNETWVFGGTTDNYGDWYCQWVEGREAAIHSIEVNGVTWTVGEVISRGSIVSFIYSEWVKAWMAGVALPNGSTSHFYIKDLRKLPSKPVIVSLPDENGKMVDLFLGDSYYVVGIDWVAYRYCVPANWNYDKSDDDRRFPTLALAEDYILQHKPVIPYGEFLDAVNFSECSKLIKKYKPSK